MKKARKADVVDFISQKTLAIVGVSRSKEKFGNTIFQELRKKEYRVFPVNANAETVDGERCYTDLKSLPEPVGGVIIVVPPEKTEQVVQDAKEAGITRIWMQYGAQSETAVDYCIENGITVVANECILMFAEPVGFLHKIHRGLWKLIGLYPR